ncbi:ABC transporter ATP-binding protein [Enterovirga sp.]|uniref:ABC transporter ATP-binding protein n=1 Tax=Enterovirga sp. TaxID=2026350 RepID=UPI002C499754|nr:ABC transporter ATP-binding protein [Enterovirga sp.]HMO27930.1 ABC transporter ATP-binding protein [Enterovirga sp.]
MSGLVIRGLSAGYRGRQIVSGLDLGPLEAGTVTALVGPNAAGKSTLLRAIAGLIPASGEILLGEEDLARLDLAARAARIGFMPQTLPQRVSLSVFESVLVALKASPLASGAISAPEARGRVMASLARLGIAGRAGDHLDRLSGGQRQLASLAQALVREPRLLLLDEPTSALDLRHQLMVMSMARALAGEGRVVVAVLHDLGLAARWADRIVVLRAGAVRASGPPETALTAQVLADTWGVRGHLERGPSGHAHVAVFGTAMRGP